MKFLEFDISLPFYFDFNNVIPSFVLFQDDYNKKIGNG